ncbi:unnamed protein product, partial [Lampetra fluviatilis]
MLALGLPGRPSSHFHDRDAERQVLASSHEALFVTERRYLRRDWCKSQPLRQTVRERGCVPRTVINRFCYGQCNSFYIPRGRGGAGSARRGAASFRACAACRPQRFSSLTVELSCPGLEPPLRR